MKVSEEKKLGQTIHSLRKKRELTQHELGDQLNVSAQSISAYENGATSISLDILIKMAKIFNVSTDYILGVTEAETANPEERQIADYLGLSVDAIRNLRQLKMTKPAVKYDESAVVSKLLTNTDFLLAIDRCCALLNTGNGSYEMNAVQMNEACNSAIRLMNKALQDNFITPTMNNVPQDTEKLIKPQQKKLF